MNPSATGWIKKLLKELHNSSNDFLQVSEYEFYVALRQSGFIYGSNIRIVKDVLLRNDLTTDEVCKVNLYLALLFTHHKSGTATAPTESLIDFYTEINKRKTSFFGDILKTRKTETQLERIIHKRIQINDNILTKNFNYFVINALLFVDVLAYQEYLEKGKVSKAYIKHIEGAIEVITMSVLNSKAHKTTYDDGLIELFESSLRYQNNAQISYEQAVGYARTPQEKRYILDIASMATWSDRTIDIKEQHFLHQLSKDLELDEEMTKLSIRSVNHFYSLHKNDIALLSSKNIVKTFYDNSTRMVRLLIRRNSKRLQKELIQSKELMVLLSKSTVKDLTDSEQRKVQDQLLDIFKTIPSLAIFILPGGALLLPIFVKLIPKLLPSAFDDNRIDDGN